MSARFLLFVLMCAAFLPGRNLPGQSVLDVTTVAAVPPPSTSFFPLSEVHRGLHGTAYTVFEGTEPEAMDVEILGLLHNAIGPHQDMILARLHGTKPEYSGVVAGMSGSPVYIDGKLVGALAYRIGEFSKEPIAGITPIGEMLEVRDAARDTELRAEGPEGREKSRSFDSALTRSAQDDNLNLPRPIDTALTRSAQDDSSNRSAQDDSSNLVIPIETPLVFTGFSPEALAFWKEHAPGLGLTPVAGIGGGSSVGHEMTPVVPGSVLPGSAVSAVLIRGDLEISATCTVTYVDPTQLLACGHPITQFGPVSMPMARAE